MSNYSKMTNKLISELIDRAKDVTSAYEWGTCIKESERIFGEVRDELRAELARRDEYISKLEAKIPKLNIDLAEASTHAYNGESARMKLEAELARRDEELKITDGLLKEATETIGAVIACCTYNSNDDAKIGIYGIDQNAFTKIDQFITHYNDAVSAGKVSVDVKQVKRENDYQNDNRTNTGG